MWIVAFITVVAVLIFASRMKELKDALKIRSDVVFLDQPAVSVVGPLPDRLVIDLFRNFLIYRIVNGLCRMAVGGR